MRNKERFLSPRIGRFNYWLCFPPDGIAATNSLKQHNKNQFILELTASRTVWNKQVRPLLHIEFPNENERLFPALEGLVLGDKEWDQDPEAWKVYRQLASSQKARIDQMSEQKWHRERPCTWDELIKEIATDQDRFEGFLDAPNTMHLSGTDRRIYDVYHKQANRLLRRGKHPLPVSLKARREAKKETLHWFRHALRNLREYRNNRPPIYWSPKCAATCRRIQKKISSA